MTKNIRHSKKAFSLSALTESSKARVMSCPGLLKPTLLGSAIKRKIIKKIREILRKM